MPRFKFASCAGRWPSLFSALALFAGGNADAARVVQDGLVYEGVPAIGADIDTGLQRYQHVRETRLLDWLSDGGLLVVTHGDEQDQLQRLHPPTAAADAATAAKAADPADPQAQALGAPGGAVTAAAAQPFSSERFAWLREEAGGAALYVAGLVGDGADGGVSGNDKVTAVVAAAAQPGAPVWAHDGQRLAFSAALRDPASSDLYIVDTAGSAGPRLVAAGSANAWQVLAWTSGDRALLVRHAVANAGDELLLVDTASGALRRVDAPGEKTPGYGRIGDARLVGDGRGVYFLGDRDSDHMQLRYVDLLDDSARAQPLATGHDIERFDVSADGRYLAWSWSEQGYSRVALYDRRAALEHPLVNLPAGVVSGLKFDRSGTRLALEIAASVAPREIYVYDLASAATTRWTHSDLGGLQAGTLVAPQAVRFPTWDRVAGRQRSLNALLYRPRQPGPHATLVMLNEIGAVPRPQLDLFAQVCVNELGVAVVVPELRGGDAGALDLGALLAWLGTQPDLWRDRVLLLGRGSGGGGMALTGLGLYGDRVRAAISIDGSTAGAKLAPIRNPVLLVRGLLSPPLDAGSAEQLLWRLHTANVTTWFIAPRDAPGTLRGAAGEAAALRVIAQFVKSYSAQVAPKAPGPAAPATAP